MFSVRMLLQHTRGADGAPLYAFLGNGIRVSNEIHLDCVLILAD